MIRIEPIDYPQLYAQAVGALREGERYWFTPEEEVLLNRNNRMFEKRPLLEEFSSIISVFRRKRRVVSRCQHPKY